MENVGETDVVNPWLSNGRDNFRTAEAVANSALAPGMTDAEKAFATFSDMIARFPGHPAAEEAMLRSAEIRAEQGMWNDALDGFNRMIAVYSNGTFLAEGLKERGLVLYSTYRFQDALGDFDRVSRDFTNTPAAEQCYYMKALSVRQLVISEYQNIFGRSDLVLTPSLPFVAPRFSEIEKMRPLEAYQADFLTVPPNLAGLPHLSLPCGYADALPMGMQFVAPHWEEGRLLDMAESWSKGFQFRFPEVCR
jgi:Asp-tRNA(Asn)/Glu-tRNA(Gln) amidotransferase A subunit family amidase